MLQATVRLKSASPYSQGKHYDKVMVPLDPENESAGDYEKRTWRNRLHVTPDGFVFIPQQSLHKSAIAAAKYTGDTIPGKGKKTWTAKLQSGLMCMEPIVLPVRADDVDGEWLFVPSDGKPGGSRRVSKCFGYIPEWSGDLNLTILDTIITEEILFRYFERAGRFIGIGRFRPERGGFYGRFTVESVKIF
mgnify:FL=1